MVQYGLPEPADTSSSSSSESSKSTLEFFEIRDPFFSDFSDDFVGNSFVAFGICVLLLSNSLCVARHQGLYGNHHMTFLHTTAASKATCPTTNAHPSRNLLRDCVSYLTLLDDNTWHRERGPGRRRCQQREWRLTAVPHALRPYRSQLPLSLPAYGRVSSLSKGATISE
jgi:hypothetical protein